MKPLPTFIASLSWSRNYLESRRQTESPVAVEMVVASTVEGATGEEAKAEAPVVVMAAEEMVEVVMGVAIEVELMVEWATVADERWRARRVFRGIERQAGRRWRRRRRRGLCRGWRAGRTRCSRRWGGGRGDKGGGDVGGEGGGGGGGAGFKRIGDTVAEEEKALATTVEAEAEEMALVPKEAAAAEVVENMAGERRWVRRRVAGKLGVCGGGEGSGAVGDGGAVAMALEYWEAVEEALALVQVAAKGRRRRRQLRREMWRW